LAQEMERGGRAHRPSASYDMGVRLRNKVDLQLSLEARDMWRNDPLFKPWFHNTGRLDCAGQPEQGGLAKDGIFIVEPFGGVFQVRVGIEQILIAFSQIPQTWLDDEDAILRKAPLLSQEQIKVGRTAWIPLTTGLESDMVKSESESSRS
jgi:sarcosine oxidase/L-pipecolate oxidase